MPPKNKVIKTEMDALLMLAEKMKAQSAKPNIYGYVPHSKQLLFHDSASKKKLYIGGNRSGKTTGGIVEDIWWLTGRHPYREVPKNEPIRGRIVSVDFVNGIEKIIIPELKRWLPTSDLINGSWEDSYDKLLRVLTLANGSFVEFMSYDQDLDKFAGTSRHFIHFDEEPPQDIFTENTARLVDTGGSFWITMTPVEGMTWVYDVLYEPGLASEGGILVVEVEMTENPHLNKESVEDFLNSLDPDERKAREKGQFVQLGGLIFKQFDKKTHVVKAGWKPPNDWLVCASLDHGFNNPTVWLWHAVSPDNEIVTFFEHYKQGMTIDGHAKAVHQINQQLGRVPDFYIGDPSIRNTQPISGTSIAEEYIKYGIPIILGNNAVSDGIIRMAKYFKLRSDSSPGWVITENCEHFIWELGRYRWATYANKKLRNDNNGKEAPHKKDDHACDSARYFIMSRPDLTPEMPDKPTLPVNGMGAIKTPANGFQFDPALQGGGQVTSRDYVTDWAIDEQLGGVW